MSNLFKLRFQYDVEQDAEAREASATRPVGESLTQQSFAYESDLNVIAERFGLGNGPMPVVPIDPAYYGDFSNAPTLREILDLKRDAEFKFMALPAKLRARFNNSMVEMHDFVMDPENADESVRLGLLKRVEPEPEAPAPVPVVVTPSVPSSGGS